ncbi:hypothetical protein [Brevibacillus porteri]|uniref:hypothetical protein n=1 Tax=Brevibacillus porteri TaxID=2126350 RepID=UPI003D1AD41E
MDLLLPITTIAMISLGAFCLFIAIDNDSRAFPKKSAPVADKESMFSMMTERKVAKTRK